MNWFGTTSGLLTVALKTFAVLEYCQLSRLSLEVKVLEASAFSHKVRPVLTPPGDWAKVADKRRAQKPSR